jgi:hypothetical protein
LKILVVEVSFISVLAPLNARHQCELFVA